MNERVVLVGHNFFNVTASGHLYSSIYNTIYSPNILSLQIGHYSQSTEHMIQITCYLLSKSLSSLSL